MHISFKMTKWKTTRLFDLAQLLWRQATQHFSTAPLFSIISLDTAAASKKIPNFRIILYICSIYEIKTPQILSHDETLHFNMKITQSMV